MTDDGTVHDLVGIGLGPFNLGLACLAAPLTGLDCAFLEAEDTFEWHPGMLLPDATLQVPFLADLVTMADPTSPYSFLAYLKDVGRLYPFYVRENFYPLRAEYTDYCRWACSRLRSVRFGHRVESVTHDGSVYVVHAVHRGTPVTLRTRRLVLGVGSRPWVPEPTRGLDGPAIHSASYLPARERLKATGSITVVGSGQSAAEIVSDLLGDIDTAGYELTWVTRSPRFFPMEYTKLTLELTSPEYARHFHALPPERRDALNREQRALHKGISGDLIDTIHEQLYVKTRAPGVRVRLLTNSALTGAEWTGSRYRLGFEHTETGERYDLEPESLVLATGYRTAVPAFLDPIRDRIRWDERGRYDVHHHYAIDHQGSEIFVQNAEEHTHALLAPDLGMGAHRNSVILREVLGRAPYPIEERVAFQEFGAPADRVREVTR